MTGKAHPETPEPPEEESAGGTIPTDPELEAALREAVESVEHAGEEKKPENRAPSGISDLLLHEPHDEADAEGLIFRLREQVAETNDRMLRLQADFDNFRKRAVKERQDALQYGHQNLVKDLLSVVDNLDRAIGHVQQSETGDLEGLLQGVELVRRQLIGVFEKYHVQEIEAQGKSFDPALHEAMAQVEDEKATPNAVVDVLEKGYQLRDRLVRPARVVVAKAPEGSKDKGGGEAAG